MPSALLVVSIPASDIEVGGEGGQQALERLKNVVGRHGDVVAAGDAPRRASRSSAGGCSRTCRAELERERDAVVQRVRRAVPRAAAASSRRECAEGDYERRLKAAYPIHPELFDRLFDDWSTLERFQRTRGVLRLMAAVIHELWERDDRAC